MNKKIFYKLGTLLSIGTPLVSTISCASTINGVSSRQSYVQEQLSSSSAAQLINKIYMNSLTNEKIGEQLAKEQKIAWKFYVYNALMKDNHAFVNKILGWVNKGYLQWSDGTREGVPKVASELGVNSHNRSETAKLLLSEQTLDSLIKAEETGIELMLNSMIISKNLLIGKKTADQLKKNKVETKEEKDSIYNFNDDDTVNNYYLIKWLVQNHPMFTWEQSFHHDTQKDIDLSVLAVWNGLNEKNQATAKFHTVSKESLFKSAPDYLSKMYGYKGMKNSLNGVTGGRFNFSVEWLKKYKKGEQVVQGFVDVTHDGEFKGDGTIGATENKHHPVTYNGFLAAYVIQILPEWHQVIKPKTGAEKSKENKEDKDKQSKEDKDKQSKKDNEKQRGYFSLPEFKDASDLDTLIYTIILQNQGSFVNQVKEFWTNNGLYISTTEKTFKKTVDNQGVGEQ